MPLSLSAGRSMPEGDSLHRAAERMQPLVGDVLTVEARHPRAAALGIAPRLDGRRLERVEAVGKNLLLTFDGDLVLRSHLRMKGRWHVRDSAEAISGLPWLVLRGEQHQAILWHGPVLELGRHAVAGLGPDIMAGSPDYSAMVMRLRQTDQRRALGEAILDQRLIAGVGNMWRAEALFNAGVSPWRALCDLTDDELSSVVRAAHELMTGGRVRRAVHRRAGLPCGRCGVLIRSRPQGDGARTSYWCPQCQS